MRRIIMANTVEDAANLKKKVNLYNHVYDFMENRV